MPNKTLSPEKIWDLILKTLQHIHDNTGLTRLNIKLPLKPVEVRNHPDLPNIWLLWDAYKYSPRFIPNELRQFITKLFGDVWDTGTYYLIFTTSGGQNAGRYSLHSRNDITRCLTRLPTSCNFTKMLEQTLHSTFDANSMTKEDIIAYALTYKMFIHSPTQTQPVKEILPEVEIANDSQKIAIIMNDCLLTTSIVILATKIY